MILEPLVSTRSGIAVLGVSIFLTACGSLALSKIATPARDERARNILREFIAGEQDSALAHARFADDRASIAAGLAQINGFLRGRVVDSVQLVGAHLFSSAGREHL